MLKAIRMLYYLQQKNKRNTKTDKGNLGMNRRRIYHQGSKEKKCKNDLVSKQLGVEIPGYIQKHEESSSW